MQHLFVQFYFWIYRCLHYGLQLYHNEHLLTTQLPCTVNPCLVTMRCNLKILLDEWVPSHNWLYISPCHYEHDCLHPRPRGKEMATPHELRSVSPALVILKRSSSTPRIYLFGICLRKPLSLSLISKLWSSISLCHIFTYSKWIWLCFNLTWLIQ